MNTFRHNRKSRWTDVRTYSPGVMKRRSKNWPVIMLLWGTAVVLGTAYGAGWLGGIRHADSAAAAATDQRVSFRYCHVGGGYNCVVDGDTIWLKGSKIRIADIDAPETHDYKCASEKELGDRATMRLHDLLESGAISLQPIERDKDIYGRKLRIVLVNGVSVGETLVSEGLARYYGNGRRPWC